MVLPVQTSNLPITLKILILQVVYSRTLAGICRKQRMRIGFDNLFDIHKTSAQKEEQTGFVKRVYRSVFTIQQNICTKEWLT